MTRPNMASRGSNLPHGPSSNQNNVHEHTETAWSGHCIPDSQPAAKLGARHSLRRIDCIARHTGAESYLEIGVSSGATFNRVSLDRKVGVDPHFRFETDKFRNERTELHALTSDRYFTEIAGSRKFDLIFIDGLHQFHQAFRDFCNSLVCSHDRTVWLIDDVLPVDVYSSLPIQRDALKFRRTEHNDNNLAWHGDVYKLIFALHDFFPMVSYVTLLGSGNPQTLAWKSPRNHFIPIFNSLEKIERLGYFDMLKHETVFNGKSERDAFDLFFASMPGCFRDSTSSAAPSSD